jgi:cation diffusion facilitator CzcD-associated flavoprotein CzcO
MKQSDVLIIGASLSGLASAACLQKQGIDYVIIDKEEDIASPWRSHYERLHLHTNKGISSLPFKKFGTRIPRYPSRVEVINYLENYQKEFNINPEFYTNAISVERKDDYWITETNKGTIQSRYVIVATGAFGSPKRIDFKGAESFYPGIIHSSQYKSGRDFKGKKVLVVGFGNSACEIAIDLYEQGAIPSMSVRSPVNMVPRDLLGIPILQVSLLMSRLPAKLADAINEPLMRLWFGDIKKLGLKKMKYGVFQQIEKDAAIPLLDIGTIKHIKKGHIKVFDGIDHISGNSVYFTDGKQEIFDAVVAAIGYERGYEQIIHADKMRFDDLKVSISKQKYFGRDGLYFCGFWISPRGQIREIGLDAKKIAKDIRKKIV